MARYFKIEPWPAIISASLSSKSSFKSLNSFKDSSSVYSSKDSSNVFSSNDLSFMYSSNGSFDDSLNDGLYEYIL